VILVDSCGWLAVVKGADLAASYAPALARPHQVLVPALCVLEVARVMCRERGEQAAADIIAVMTQGVVVPLDLAMSAAAAFLSERTGLPCADGIIYATAQSHGAEVWTHDQHFHDLPGVHFVEPAAGAAESPD
jgi:predicted nucleic acid-binding protein